jgi:hypothetical protein
VCNGRRSLRSQLPGRTTRCFVIITLLLHVGVIPLPLKGGQLPHLLPPEQWTLREKGSCVSWAAPSGPLVAGVRVRKVCVSVLNTPSAWNKSARETLINLNLIPFLLPLLFVYLFLPQTPSCGIDSRRSVVTLVHNILQLTFIESKMVFVTNLKQLT